MASMYRIKTTAHVGWGRCVEHGLGTVCGTWAGDSVWNMGWGRCVEHGLGTMCGIGTRDVMWNMGWGWCVEHGLGMVCGTWAGDGMWNVGWRQCVAIVRVRCYSSLHHVTSCYIMFTACNQDVDKQ